MPLSQTSQRRPPGARPWPLIALAAGTLLLGAGVSTWVARQGARAPGDCTCEPVDGLRREVGELRSRLEELRFAVQLSSATSSPPALHQAVPAPTSSPGDAPPGSAVAPAERPDQPGPRPAGGTGGKRYARFDVPVSLVSVRQAPTGELVVENIEPSLTGRTLVITAFTADGAPETLSITVPAPARP